MTYTFLAFRRACLAQGFDRTTLPYVSVWQPYTAYYALVCCFVMTFVGGYPVFLAGKWDVPTFLFSYMMVAVFPCLYVGWKLLKGTKRVRPAEVDLTVGGELEAVERYQREYVPKPPR